MPNQPQTAEAIAHYTRRAPDYDGGSNGWHIALGEQFVADINPPQGARCLDLACGTGLVTFPLARAAGPDGARIEFVEHDVSYFDDVLQVQAVVARHGGFDVVACCSALVLLADPAAAVRSWAALLRPGGVLVAEVPTETHTLQ